MPTFRDRPPEPDRGLRQAQSSLEKSPGSAVERTAQLEAQLETYRKTLTEIYELYDKKIEELSLIRRISDSIRTPLDLETLCREIVDAVAHEIQVDRLSLMLVDQDREGLAIKASFDAGLDETRFYGDLEAKRLPLDEGEAGQAVRAGHPVLLASVSPEPDPLAQAPGPPVSLLLLPLVARDKPVGLFSLSRPAGRPFGEADVRVLTIISDQAATALANVQLFNELAAANVRLQESELRARRTSLYLESLLEAANDVIFILDAKGRITYVNRKVEEWGYDKDSLMGRALDEFMAGPDSGSDQAGRLISRGEQVLEAGLKTGTGERRDVLLSTSGLEGRGERGSAWLVLARDITERKQLEGQLFHSEKLASIGILAAGVAHEIGNPLSAISGYAQILQSGGIDQAEAEECLEGIESQTARIQRIIEDLLNYSRPSAGLRSDINLAEAVPQVMSMLSAQKAFKDLDLEYDLADDLPPVLMDRDHLAQIIVNIALNAAQAMPEGGRLTVSLRAAGGRVMIVLTDNGPGIPTEMQARVFDPFFTTKPVGQGTGLGLAICYKIVESYNGSIEVKSQPGRGTSFTVTLPAGTSSRT